MGDYWDDLGGGVKAILVVGVLIAVGLVAYYRMAEPSAEDVSRNAALRDVNNQR